MATQKHIVDLLLSGITDFHRGNMFEVELQPLPDLPNQILTSNMIKQVTIPSINQPDIEIKRMGQKVAIPGGVEFDKLAMTLRDDEESKIREYFIKWQERYHRNLPDGDFNPNIHGLIQGKVVIYQLGSKHQRTTRITAFHAWPMTVGDIDLSHDNEDTISEFNVQFAYSYAKHSFSSAGGIFT